MRISLDLDRGNYLDHVVPQVSKAFVARILHGETEHGTCLGPLVLSQENFDDFCASLSMWSDSKVLEEFQFERGPSFLSYWCEHNHELVAQAITYLLHSPTGSCILLEEGRVVRMYGTASLYHSNQVQELQWQYGAIRDLEIFESPLIPGAFISTARSPCLGNLHLEVNSGKGFDAGDARLSAIGECIERLSAIRDNTNDVLHSAELKFDLGSFHPFGDEWENYRKLQDAPPLETTLATDLLSGELVMVPRLLAQFPLDGQQAASRPTRSDTSGFACFPTYPGAVERGLREVLERDDLYPNFLCQKRGWKLEVDHQFTETLRAHGFRVWHVTYGLEGRLRIVQSFVEDPVSGVLGRGSGSGFSWPQALDRALCEALQICHFARERLITHGPEAYEWRPGAAKESAVAYLDSMTTSHPNFVFEEVGDPLQALIFHLAETARTALVLRLNCPIIDWYTVRVLVPGATCHQYPSDSAGGRPISRPLYRFPIPI